MKVTEELFQEIYFLKEKELHEKYEFLGEGISRKVFSLNNEYVIKYAKGTDGIYQNMVEHFVYMYANQNLRKYLCPIVCFKPKLCIMKKATPLSSFSDKKYIDVKSIRSEKNIYEDLNFLADKFYLYYEDIISTSSWGVLDGKNVLIDYGCTTPQGDIFYDFTLILTK